MKIFEFIIRVILGITGLVIGGILAYILAFATGLIQIGC